MALNPMALLKLKDRLKLFREAHPRVPMFFRAIREDGLEEGTVLELKVITKDGRERVTNIRLTGEDVETLKMLEHLR